MTRKTALEISEALAQASFEHTIYAPAAARAGMPDADPPVPVDFGVYRIEIARETFVNTELATLLNIIIPAGASASWRGGRAIIE